MTEGTSPEPPRTSTPISTSTSTPTPTETPAPAAPQPAPTTRTGVAFGALIAGAIVLILLLVFILENTESVKISYFGAGGHLPLGVALLLAAIGGALVTGIVGAARIMQLRRHVRRRSRR
jgi:lipopolysaccharide assembly protein A